MAPVGRDGASATAAKAPTGSAGFGSPGADATVHRLDLNEALIRHPEATVMMRTDALPCETPESTQATVCLSTAH